MNGKCVESQVASKFTGCAKHEVIEHVLKL